MTNPYFAADVETATRDSIQAMQLRRLLAQLRHVGEQSPFYRDKWRASGFDPAAVTSFTDFAAAPLTRKEELRESQLQAPPLGRHAAVPLERVARVHSSSGTTGRPSYVGVTRRDALDWTEAISRCLYSEGMRPDDVVLHAMGLGFFVGGMPLKDAVENIGATLVPVGTGATDRLVTSARDLHATVLMCTPSYATYLAEQLRERFGTKPAELGLRTVILGAEPGGSIPAVRRLIEQEYAAAVSEGMGNADLIPIYAATCPEQQGMHLMAPDLLYLELLDPDSGEVLPWVPGIEGELVATHLRRECVPLVRMRVNDRIQVDAVECPCGRTGPRIRCVGRTDDMLIVAGVNVWPTAVKDVVAALRPRTTGAVQIVVPDGGVRVEPPLRVEVEHGRDEADLGALRHDVVTALRERLIVPCDVELVAPGALPRTEMKAQLVRRGG